MSGDLVPTDATNEIGVLVEVRFEDGSEVRYIRRHKDGKVLRYTQRRDGSWSVPAQRPRAQFSAKRLVSTKPSTILEELKQECPWILDYDRAKIDRFVRAESRLRALDARLQQMQAEGVQLEDIPTRFWNALRDAEVNADKMGQDLGLDPTGRQKLLKDAAWAKRLATESVTQIADRGRRLRAIEE